MLSNNCNITEQIKNIILDIMGINWTSRMKSITAYVNNNKKYIDNPRWQQSRWELHLPPRTKLELQLSYITMILSNQLKTSLREVL